MIHKYAKEKGYHRELEVAWSKHDEKYEITKRSVSGKNSQGHTMQFSTVEIRYLREMLNKI